MRKRFLLFLVLAFALAAIPAFADGSVSGEDKQTAPGDVLVILKNQSNAKITRESLSSGVGISEVNSFAESVGASIKETYSALSEAANEYFLLVHSDTKSETELLEELRNRPDVSGASLNYRVHILADDSLIPNDPRYSSLWGLKAINAPQAWVTGTGNDEIYSAVIDTGVDYNHEDLKDNFETSGYSKNFVNSDPKDYMDGHSHGTHVAGTIGAVGNNSIGVVGVNWSTKIIALRVLNSDGRGYTSDTTRAVNEVLALLTDHPDLKIASVNLSLGGYQYTTPEKMKSNNDPEWKAFSLLSQTNRTVICVAAGNESLEVGEPAPSDDPYGQYKKGQYCYPASFLDIDNMLVVASATSSKARSYFSNYSAKFVDITAPGSSILSTTPNSLYGTKSGTSMATPHVAGAVSLLASIYPEATAQQLKEAIIGGADAKYCVDDGTSVNGFLDLVKSIEYLAESGDFEPVAPVVTTTTLPEATDGTSYSEKLRASGTVPITWSISGGSLPSGLTLESSGLITGIPKETGTKTFTAKATNKAGSAGKSLTIKVNPVKPTISIDVLPDAVLDTAYSYNFKAKGTAPITWSISAGSPPTGLTLSSAGLLSGTPTKKGNYNFTVKASNSAGSDTKDFNMIIAGDPTILTETLPTSSTAAYYSVQLRASGSSPLKWSIAEGKLPGTLSLDSTGYLRGYVTPADEGTKTFTVRVDSPKGYDTKQLKLSLGVRPQIMDYYLPVATVGEFYSVSLDAIGTKPLTWSLYNYTLPSGLELNPSGSISGTPTTQTYRSIYMKVSNDISASYGYIYLDIRQKGKADTGIKINTSKLPTAVFGEPYSLQLTASGASQVTWSADLSEIKGLSLSSSGLISGIPLKDSSSQWGKHTTFTITASTSSGGYATKYLNFEVLEKPTITTSSLSDGSIGTYYNRKLYASYGLTAPVYSGDVAPESWGWNNPVTWSITKGSLPDGLALDVLGNIGGVPTKSGTFTFTAEASISGIKATKEYSLKIKSNVPVITTDNLKTPYNGEYYNEYIYADGISPFTWKISEGSLPSGLNFYSYSNYAYIAGYANKNGKYTFTVSVSNSAGSDSKEYTLNVSERPIENLDFRLIYSTTSGQILNGKTKYDKVDFSSMYFRLGKVYDYTKSLLERTADALASEHEELEQARAEGIISGDVADILAIVSDDDGTIRIEDAFTIGTGPLGYRQNYGYISPDTEVTFDLKANNRSYYYPIEPRYKNTLYLYDSADVALKNREITWQFPDELSHLNGGITLDKLRSVKDHLDTAVPYFELVKPNSAGKFTAIAYRLAKASDTSKAVSLGYDGTIDFQAYGYIKSGDNTYYRSFVYDTMIVSADDIVEGEKELAVPISINDLSSGYAYSNISDGYIQYFWGFDFLLPPEITTTTLPEASVGSYYSESIRYNGSSVTSWDIVSGALPKGLTLERYGSITGTPEKSGTFSFTVRAANSAGYDTKQITLSVKAAPLPSNLKMRVSAYFSSILDKGKTSYEKAGTGNLDISISSIFDNSAKGHYVTEILEDGREVVSFKPDNEASISETGYKHIKDGFTIAAGSGDYYYSGGTVASNTELKLDLCYYGNDYAYYNTYYPTMPSSNWSVSFYDWDKAFKNRKFSWKMSSDLSYLNGSVTLNDFRSINDQLNTAIPYVELIKPNAEGKFTAYKWRMVKANNPSKAVATGFDGEISLQVNFLSGDNSTYYQPGVYARFSADVPAEGEVTLNYPATVKNTSYVYASLASDTIKYTWYFRNAVPVITTRTISEGFTGRSYSNYLSANGETPLTWTLESGSLPAGLSVDKGGRIYGTPRKAGTYEFTVKVSNSYGEDKRDYSLVINSAVPVISTDSQLPDAIVGTKYSVALQADGATPITWYFVSGLLPNGLVLDSNSGIISGTPKESGTFIFAIRAGNSYGSVEKTFTINVTAKPNITTGASLKSGKTGSSYSVTLKADGTTPLKWSLRKGNLPNGLSLNAKNGKITGTPTTDGTFKFTVRAKNDYGYHDKEFTIVIGTKPKISTGATLSKATVKTSYSKTLKASGTTPIEWTIESGNLPSGLKLNKTSGKLSGTPTAEGTFTFNVKALNEFGSVTKWFTLVVGKKPSISTSELPAGITGEAYTTTLKASGTKAITWSKVSGTLPTGLKLAKSSGKLSGTPTKEGTFKFKVRASNDYGYNDKELTVTIGTKPSISTGATLSKAVLKSSYSTTLKAKGTTPITWSLSSGALPDGLKLTKSSGKISGTPTKEGTFKFKIKAKNDYGTASKTFTIVAGKKPSISTSELPDGIIGEAYTTTLKASGTKAITWSKASGTLPTGLKIAKSSGKLSGTPTKEGSFTFTVRAENEYGQHDKKFTVTVGSKPKISTGATLKAGTLGVKYTLTLKATGTAPLTWSRTSGTLPTGVKLNASTGKLSGTPTKAGTFSFKIKAANIYGTHSKSFKLTVNKTASASSITELEEAEDEYEEDVISEVQNITSSPEVYTAAVNPEAESNSIHSSKTGAELNVIDNDGEPAKGIVKIAQGQDLLFELGAWYSYGREVEVSGAKVYVDDEVYDAQIEDDGTFVLDARESGDEFVVYVKAFSPSGEELKSDEAYIVIE